MRSPLAILRRARALLGPTQWQHSPYDGLPREIQFGPKLWIPLYYVYITIAGYAATYLGSPILNREFDPQTADVFGGFLMVAGGAGFLCIAFPRLALLELVALLWIDVLLGTFAYVILTAPPTDPSVPWNLYIGMIVLASFQRTFDRITILFASDEVVHPVKAWKARWAA